MEKHEILKKVEQVRKWILKADQIQIENPPFANSREKMKLSFFCHGKWK